MVSGYGQEPKVRSSQDLDVPSPANNIYNYTKSHNKYNHTIHYDSLYIIYDGVRYSIDTMAKTKDSGFFRIVKINDYTSKKYYIIYVEPVIPPYETSGLYTILSEKNKECTRGTTICEDSVYYMHLVSPYKILGAIDVKPIIMEDSSIVLRTIDEEDIGYRIVWHKKTTYIRSLSLHSHLATTKDLCGVILATENKRIQQNDVPNIEKIIPASNSQGLGNTDSIDKMKCNVSFISVRGQDNRSRSIYMINRNQDKYDTILGTSLHKNYYRFYYCDDIYVELELRRKWDILRPLYNSYSVSDTVSLLPIGIMELHNKDSVILFQGYSSAYQGPQVKKKKHIEYKYRSICSLSFEDYVANP